jgi:hypothetical protein
MTNSAANRIDLIRRSMRVFVCGILSMIPVLGLLPAIYTIAAWFPTRGNKQWNPACAYLTCGILLALLGLGLTILLGGAALIQFAR